MPPQTLRGTAFGEVLAYLDNHWRGLVRYCADGRYGMDTNLADVKALRPMRIAPSQIDINTSSPPESHIPMLEP